MTEPENNDDTPLEADEASTKVTEPIAELKSKPKGAKPLKSSRMAVAAHKLVILGVLVTLMIAAGAFVYLRHSPSALPSEEMPPIAAPKAAGPLAVFAKGEMAGLVTLASPQKAEDIAFFDRNKKELHLSDFKGQVVVLNVWATWCAPCRHEMPTLANLSKTYESKNLKVVALSVDVEDEFSKVISFMDVMTPLNVYTDPNFAAPKAFGIEGMPVTLVLNKKGEIVARIDGVAKWDTPESYALMDKLLSAE